MNLFAKLFGSNDLVKAAIDTGDALIYTKEEKAVGFEKLLKLYEPFKIAQRFLALMVGIPFVSIHLICSISWLACAGLIEQQNRYILVADRIGSIMQYNNDALFAPFCIIIGFYFGGGATEGIIRELSAKK